MNDTALTTTEDSTAMQLISMAEMPQDQIKRAMDRIYLQTLVDENPNLKKKDFIEFIVKCQLTGADPRLNQVYLLPHEAWNSQKKMKEPKGTTVFSYQFFIRLAQQTGLLEDWGVDNVEDTYLDMNTGKRRHSLTSTAYVVRKGQGRITYKARFWEFAKTDFNGNLSGNWKNSPYLMIDKCAVANAMRWAFPETLGNLYIYDEMEKATQDHDRPQHRPQVNRPQPTVKPPVTVVAAESTAVQEDVEDMRDFLLNFLTGTSDTYFEKVGRTREAMVEKVRAETEAKAMAVMFDYVKRTSAEV
jgi:phage recombination protein Bet